MEETVLKIRLRLISAALLTALMISLSLISCGSPDAGKKSVTTAAGDGSETAETAPDPFFGLETADCGGKTFTLLTDDMYLDGVYTESENGDVLNDALYERNRTVEEKLNIKISVRDLPGGWTDRQSFMDTLRGSVMAGQGAYDLVNEYSAIVCFNIADGIFLNLLDLPHLRFESPWWSKVMVEDLTVNGKLFDITGDISTSLWDSMFVMFFNKERITDYGLESPYELVESGKWSFDKYLELNVGIASDVNGDGVMNDEDMWGSVYYDTLALDNFRAASDVPCTVRGTDGKPTLDLNSDGMVRVAERVMELAYSNPDVRFIDNTADATTAIFMAGRGIFYGTMLSYASQLRAMDEDFGIIPFPKDSEEQENYYTSSRDSRSMIAITIDVKDPDFSALVTEALCATGRSIIIPAYYDVALKGKAARDEESAAMLDIIRDGLVSDFSTEHAQCTASAGYVVRMCVMQKTGIASLVASNESKWNAAFESFLEAYY